jgi:hypothetical protein
MLQHATYSSHLSHLSTADFFLHFSNFCVSKSPAGLQTYIYISSQVDKLSMSHPNYGLLNELYELIERSPPAIEARIILIDHCIAVGWNDAALDYTNELLKIQPRNKEAQKYKIILTTPAVQGIGIASPSTPFRSDGLVGNPKPRARLSKTPAPPPRTSRLWGGGSTQAISDDEKRGLVDGYKNLMARAQTLQKEAQLLRDLPQGNNTLSRLNKHILNLAALSGGRINVVTRVRPPAGPRTVVSAMENDTKNAVDIAMKDLEDMYQYLNSSSNPRIDEDTIRDRLFKRAEAIKTAHRNPELQKRTAEAFMHTEHELLQKQYARDETVFGDPVADIPRENFWVSEDGYAWDMEELVQAVTANGGVMRNPYSKALFTTNDIKAIIAHPQGACLKALQVEQSQLSKGIRAATITKMEELAKILLEDQSAEAIPSREAVEDFLAYVALLPEGEEFAIDRLRVPARDTHTGAAYDMTIGEAVRDAKANRICFHKTGDFVRQAASHLRLGLGKAERDTECKQM